jgi:hypothetical protein
MPSIIMRDITKVKASIVRSIREYQEKLLAGIDPEFDDVGFDATKYLYLSKRLANKFPTLPESKIIRLFSTPFPKR